MNYSEKIKQIEYWFGEPGPLTDVVLSTRVRMSRNLESFPFARYLKEEQRRDLEQQIRDYCSSFRKEYRLFNLSRISRLEKQILQERYLLHPDFCRRRDALVYLNEPEGKTISVCDRDHLHLTAFRSGFPLLELTEMISREKTLLEEQLSLAADEELGWLTHSLTDTGLGMKYSVILHLPGICLTGEMPLWQQEALEKKCLLEDFDWNGRHHRYPAGMLQLFNITSFFRRETELTSLIRSLTDRLITRELELRERIRKGEFPKIEDLVYRAWGLLKYGRMINQEESFQALSYLRLGIILGWVSGPDPALVTRLLGLVQDGHMKKLFSLEKPVPDDDNFIKSFRGEFLRKVLR